ncbi:hypothetical protein cypCar_00029793, partial [Cyprinus carpio]
LRKESERKLDRLQAEGDFEVDRSGCESATRVCGFWTLDPEQTGFIAVENFTSLAEHHELQLDPSKLEMLLALVQSNEHGHVCYQELIELIRALGSKRSSQLNRSGVSEMVHGS